MISRRTLLATATATAAASGTAVLPLVPAQHAYAADRPRAAGDSTLRVTGTSTEYADRPLGLDTARPRLSWTLGSHADDQLQHAWQVRVASSPGLLAGHPDIWDSGKRTSRRSVLVPYAGPALNSRTRYHWSVRVWDAQGRPSAWSEPTWWETGLTGKDDWHARWIGAPATLTDPPDPAGASWIWFPEDGAADQLPAGTRYFRAPADVAGQVRRARLVLAADDGCTAYVNGTEVAACDSLGVRRSWSRPLLADVTRELRTGANTLAVSATNSEQGSAGLLAVLEVTTDHGTQRFTSDDGWRTTDAAQSDGWQSPGHDDSGWRTARTVGAWGDDPWGKVRAQQSPAQLRRAFTLPSKPVARARLYATALGLYEAHLNGHRAGHDQLTPGWSDYNKRVAYQCYDVTDALRTGANVLACTLAPGWYAGNVSSFGQQLYGQHAALRAQLEVVYEDGSTDRFGTDEEWRAASGPLVTADLIMGEQYDARAETPGWRTPGFDDSGWQHAAARSGVSPALVATTQAPTREMQHIEPVAVTQPEPGVHLFDLGQNMVGGVRITVRGGEAGATLRLRHGEVLQKDGSLYVANLRTARATDTYTLSGSGEETYQPRFTFHGFRYVEVTGYPGTPSRDAVTGCVMHTSAPSTLEFSTDDPLLNQLHHNITWGQRGNFLSVPTDTPARDERLGWCGDINVFAPTAAYTMESARFLTKWLGDLRDGQDDEGAYPDFAPVVGDDGKGVAGWGDAGVTVPWALYQAYGDRRVLEENLPSMRRWISYLQKHSDGLLRPAEGFGDWLDVDDETPKDVIATAYFAHATDVVARAAKALGEDAAELEQLLPRIRAAFNSAYVDGGSGRLKGDTQTGYVLALSMDLLPDATAKRRAADRLVELIKARGGHLSTGFLGTPRLLPVLTAAGHTDVAHALLHQRSFPSWGYQIGKGSTTMWERWDSIEPDGSFQDEAMNSFNHYAYGSVGEWMYQNLAGIAPGEPGFRTTVVRPRPGGGVHRASARYDTLYGPVSTHWNLDTGGRFTLSVSVPVNTRAQVWIPAERQSAVRAPEGARFERMAGGCAVYGAGSGTYRFSTGD